MVCTALVTATVLCSRFKDLSVSVRKVRVLSSIRLVFIAQIPTTGFEGDVKPGRKTRETATRRRGIQQASRT